MSAIAKGDGEYVEFLLPISTRELKSEPLRERGIEIGYSCIIDPGVVIGAGTKIMHNVELRKGTRIGQRCYIDSGVITSGDCDIGDDVTLRYGAIIARGCRIGNGSYLAPRVMTNNLDHHRESIGGAHVGESCFIGTHAVLGAGIIISNDTTIGACALVTKSILVPGKLWIGVPARMHMRGGG